MQHTAQWWEASRSSNNLNWDYGLALVGNYLLVAWILGNKHQRQGKALLAVQRSSKVPRGQTYSSLACRWALIISVPPSCCGRMCSGIRSYGGPLLEWCSLEISWSSRSWALWPQSASVVASPCVYGDHLSKIMGSATLPTPRHLRTYEVNAHAFRRDLGHVCWEAGLCWAAGLRNARK